MNTKRLRWIFLALILLSLLLASLATGGGDAKGDKTVIYVLKIEGTITEGTSLEVVEGLREAGEIDAEAVLVELDTPGGLVDSTLKITEAILNSEVPVITYVTPKGAIAASAGSFILVSGNIAAMAPGTTTGAAMPVEIGMEGRKAADEKTIKFYAGYVESIAASRGRNATQAKRFVTENDVLNENTALERGIIDLIAEDETELLNKVDGMTVKIGTENRTLATKNASLYIKEKSVRSYLLETLSNPQIAFILLMVGMYGLIFGFMSPGTYVPEMIGAICLILSLYGMGLFEVNMFGVLLIIIAVILFIAEALTPTFGILTTGGAVCLIIGALILPKEPFLFNPQSEWFEGFLLTIIGVVVATAVFFFFAIGAVLKVRKRRAMVGAEELIGRVTRAETEINEEKGTIKIRGEIWNARTLEGEGIKEREKVEIVDREGLTLIVKRKE
uniref:Membrane-bound protease n=1 Tax=Candidatus Methanophagaceae archaeon ANME-1 ERB6 TaxID=2759912 RepID=A0A7G9Z194_9EURY|nr:membrane-bound protease [Methanosarcinales archaeon ANME-1 ERB6]